MVLVIKWLNAQPKEVKYKICQKIGPYAKVCRGKYRKTKQNDGRSNNQSARFTGNKKKNTNIHLVADEDEILETTPREDIPWIDSIHVQFENNTTYSANNVQKSIRPTKQGVTKHSQG